MRRGQHSQVVQFPLRAHVGNRLPGAMGADVEPTETRIDEIVNEYIEHLYAAKRFSGARVDAWYLKTMFGMSDKPGPKLDVEYLENISAPMVSRFLDVLTRERHLSGKTVNRFRELINRLINWAMFERGIVMPGQMNPITFVRAYKERRPSVRYLSMSEIQQQIITLAGDYELQVMVATLIYAGLRRSELLWLTPGDVDIQAGRLGVIRIRAKMVHGEFWETKTGVDRAIPVNSSLRPFLERWEGIAEPGRVWYFPSRRGQRWDMDNFAECLRNANRAAGLAWSCLDFRHTFGSQLAMKGVSLYKISALMGNSPEICRRHYAVLSAECLIDEVEFPVT